MAWYNVLSRNYVLKSWIILCIIMSKPLPFTTSCSLSVVWILAEWSCSGVNVARLAGFSHIFFCCFKNIQMKNWLGEYKSIKIIAIKNKNRYCNSTNIFCKVHNFTVIIASLFWNEVIIPIFNLISSLNTENIGFALAILHLWI